MADPTQVVASAFGLAKSVLEVAKLLQRLSRARSEARDLYENTLRLRSIAVRIATFLEERESLDQGPYVEATLRSIKGSLDSCEKAVSNIYRVVQPRDPENDSSWFRRVNYVWSTDIIKEQEQAIKLNLDFLGVDWHILHSLEHDRLMRTLDTVLEYRGRLEQGAREEQAIIDRSLENLDVEPPPYEEEDPALPSPVDEEELNRFEIPPHLNTDSTPLAVAVRRQQADAVESLLGAGLDPGVKDSDDWTLIHHASYNLDRETLRHLLSELERLPAQFIDAADKRGDTALILAAKHVEHEASYGIAEQLLVSGCDPNVVNHSSEIDRDALYYAIEGPPKTENRVNFAQLLVTHNADTTIVNKAFPNKVKQYPGLSRDSNEAGNQEEVENAEEPGEEVVEAEDRDGTGAPLERRETLTDKIKRKLSISQPNGVRA